MRPVRAGVVAVGLALVMGCSATGSPESQVVGTEGAGGAGGSAGSAGFGGSSSISTDGGSNAFKARIEQGGIEVKFLTLACSGECADIVAVATGGREPYTFAWENGSAAAARRVCPTADTAYRVRVTDSASTSGEIALPARTVEAAVTADVLECPPDGGAPVAPCFANPSFEGAVTPTQFEAFDAPPWNACYAGGLTYAAIADPSLWPFQNWTFPAAVDGATYLALGQQAIFAGRASQTLCQPIPAGEPRSFLVSLARAPSTQPELEAAEQAIQVLGGTECNEAELLWTSPQLTLEWVTHCVTVRPAQTLTSLAFRPLGSAGGQMEGLVDHIVPVERCP